MIELFGAQTPSGTNPLQLAHGISVALYNTAFGLIIAVPAMIAWRFFRSRVDDTVVEMEQQSLRLIDTMRNLSGRGVPQHEPAAPPVAPPVAAAAQAVQAAVHPGAAAPVASRVR